MESKNVIILKHHPMNVKFTNPWYTSQVNDDLGEYVIVDVTSRVLRDKKMMNDHPSIHKDFSPFFMGPVVTRDGLTAHIFEHYWQASKVFPCHVDYMGEIKNEYWQWRKDWFDKTKVINKTTSRRPHSLLEQNDNDCLYSLHYNGTNWERLSYVEARKKMYITEYAKLVVNSDSYKWLKKLYEEGKKIALVDFDGFNYYSDFAKTKLYGHYIKKCKNYDLVPTHSLNDFIGIKNMNDAINCEFTPVGHSFIIKMLLEGDIEVINGEVIDHIGALSI